jgi:hypothetical protein
VGAISISVKAFLPVGMQCALIAELNATDVGATFV